MKKKVQLSLSLSGFVIQLFYFFNVVIKNHYFAQNYSNNLISSKLVVIVVAIIPKEINQISIVHAQNYIDILKEQYINIIFDKFIKSEV